MFANAFPTPKFAHALCLLVLVIPCFTLQACVVSNGAIRRQDRALIESFEENQPAPTAPKTIEDTHVLAWRTAVPERLAQLLDAARKENASLRVRRARLLAAKHDVQITNASRLPRVAIDGNGGYSRSETAFGTVTGWSMNATLPISYEVNLRGAEMDRVHASELSASALGFEMQDAILSTEFGVAGAYLSLTEANERLRVLARQVKISASILASSEEKVKAGLAAESDASLQRLQLEETRALIESVREERSGHQRRLAILLGPNVPFDDLLLEACVTPKKGRDDQPCISDQESIDLPVEYQLPRDGSLLRHRPDIQAAFARAKSAEKRADATSAGAWPTLRLLLTPGYTWQKNAISGMPSSTAHGFTLNGTVGLRMPLFEGFAREGQQNKANAEFQAFVEALRGALHEAEREAAHTLRVLQARIRDHHARQVHQKNAQRTLVLIRSSYENGMNDNRALLDAQVRLLRSEMNAVRSKWSVLQARLMTLRAFGGALPSGVRAYRIQQNANHPQQTRRDIRTESNR